MDVNQFQEFLAQLVSLQALGLDAQHLIDEAKKAGAEEALKNVVSPAPVDGEAPVVEVPVSDKKYSEVEAQAMIAEALKAQKADFAARVKAEEADIDAIFAEVSV